MSEKSGLPQYPQGNQPYYGGQQPPAYSESYQHQPMYPPQQPIPPTAPVASPEHIVIQTNAATRNVNVTRNGQNTVIIQSQPTTVHVTGNFAPFPIRLNCPGCSNQVTTRINHVPGTKQWVCAGALCFLGLWCCAPFPFCMDSCKDVEHYCPVCNNFLGKHQRIVC